MLNQQKTIDVKALQDKIKWHPHPMQEQIIDCYLQGKPMICVVAGNRSGKTMTAAFLLVLELLTDNKRCLICAPNYQLCDRTMEFVRKWLTTFFNSPVDYVNKPVPKITLPWNSTLTGASAESITTTALGASFNLIVCDEMARIPREIFENYLYPRLGELKGKFVGISTPTSKNYFYELYLKCKEDGSAFSFPTSSNPYYPPESIALYQQKLPKQIFEREFLAQFSEGLTSIFPNARELVNPKLPREAHPGCFHYIGLDVAKQIDYSAITVIDETTNEVIYLEKWNLIPYNSQIAKIEGIVSRFRPAKVIIDSRGPGIVVADHLRASGISVQDWASCGTISKDLQKKGNKELLVDKAVALFSSHSISFPDDQGLLDELSVYTYNLSPSGNISYSAPEGLTDDQVESLMLACWNLEIRSGSKKPQIWKATKPSGPVYYYPDLEM